MSGHSKWSTIKHKKAALDSKRSGVFTKMAKAITVAVKKGGGIGNPDMNFALRLAIAQARAVNMPHDNIERAIDKGTGKGGDGREIEELTLEGYGPSGIAIVIIVLTDNRNRTVSEIKNILEKNGGRLGEPGSVLFQFERVGEITIKNSITPEQELELIDLGMVDFATIEESSVIYCRVEDAKKIMDYLANKSGKEIEAQITYKPKLTVEVPGGDSFGKLIDALDDHDDVQEIYANTL